MRLAAFGLITSLFVGVIYVITKPLIIEAKEEARIAQLYALAEPLLSKGAIQTPVRKELPSSAPTSLERPRLRAADVQGRRRAVHRVVLQPGGYVSRVPDAKRAPDHGPRRG